MNNRYISYKFFARLCRKSLPLWLACVVGLVSQSLLPAPLLQGKQPSGVNAKIGVQNVKRLAGIQDSQLDSNTYLPLISRNNDCTQSFISAQASQPPVLPPAYRTTFDNRKFVAPQDDTPATNLVTSVGEGNIVRIIESTTGGTLYYLSRGVTDAWGNGIDLEAMTGDRSEYRSLSLSLRQQQLELFVVDGDGHLWNTTRHTNEGWSQFSDVELLAGERGSFTLVASTVVSDSIHVVGATSDGHLWHTIRHADGSWDDFGDVESVAGEHGEFSEVAVATVMDELQVVAMTKDGLLWHTIRHADGSWANFADVGQAVGEQQPYLKLTVTSVNDELHLVGANNDTIFHTIRHSNGIWDSLVATQTPAVSWGGRGIADLTGANVNQELHLEFITIDHASLFHTTYNSDGSWDEFRFAGDIGRFLSEYGVFTGIAARKLNDGMHLLRVTLGGDILHTIQRSANSWEAFENIEQVAGEKGFFTDVAAVGIDDELQVVGRTSEGRLWHTIRHTDGSWEPLSNIERVVGDVGAFVKVAVGSIQGELHIIGAVCFGGSTWHTVRHADGTWDGFHLLIPPPDARYYTNVVLGTLADELHVVIVTLDSSYNPHLWYARCCPNGLWTSYDAIPFPTGNYMRIGAMAGVATSDELHLLTLKEMDNTFQYTVRYADGSWSPYGDVKQLAGDKGTVLNVAATDINGELYVVIMTNEGEGRLWSTTRHADGSWDSFSEIVTS